MTSFGNFINGQTPNWRPEIRFGLMEDIESSHGILVTMTPQPIYAMIPFCLYSYTPAYKGRWGIEEKKLIEVYPFVELVNSKGDSISGRTIVVPAGLTKEREIQVAKQHIFGPNNDMNFLNNPLNAKVKKEILIKCEDRAEQYLDSDEEIEIHPHDPTYDDN